MSAPSGSRQVDLNADLGEEITDDAGLLQIVTSANVACGYHAGSPAVMAEVCERAAHLGVTIGAHVSYADRANFGRVAVDVSPDVLREQVADQLGMLASAAAAAGVGVTYVKPHGALYHRVGVDEGQAEAVLDATGDLPVLGMPGALILDRALVGGRQIRLEGFPDRAYAVDGTLVPRDQPGAVLEDPAAVADAAVRMAERVDSLCVHGDTPDAVGIARHVRRRLDEAGWSVESAW